MKKLLIPPVFILVCLALMVLFYYIFPDFNIISFPFNMIGILVAIAGFVIMNKARDLFMKHSTSFMYDKSSHLITDGIFSKTRNPMYIGMFLMVLGIGICFMNLFSILIAFVFLLLIHFISIPIEEKMMYDTFGQEFLDYKRDVPRWL